MINITKEQFNKRWDELPDNIKEAFFSDYNESVLLEICQSRNISSENLEIIGKNIGDVILGFLHSGDLANEIRKDIKIDPSVIDAIVFDVNKKIIAPLKLDLDKIYLPAAQNPGQMNQNISTGKFTSPSPEENLVDLKTIQQEKEAPVILHQEPTASNLNVINPQPAKPLQETPTVINLSSFQNSSTVQSAKPIENNLNSQIKTETPEIAPTILRTQEEVQTIKTEKKSLGGLFGVFKKSTNDSNKPEMVVAQVQLSNSAPVDKKVSNEPPKIKVVHYSAPAPVKNPFAGDINSAKQDAVEIKAKDPVSQTPQTTKSVQPTQETPAVINLSSFQNSSTVQPISQNENINLKNITVQQISPNQQPQSSSKVEPVNLVQNQPISSNLQSAQPLTQVNQPTQAASQSFKVELRDDKINSAIKEPVMENTVVLKPEVQKSTPNIGEVKLEHLPVKDDFIDLRSL